MSVSYLFFAIEIFIILITLKNMVKNKNDQLTYTYFSNSDSDFAYHAIKDDMRNENETEEDMRIEDHELIVKVRISDGWEYNQHYKILLTFVGLGVTKNHSILLEFERSCLPFNTSAICSTQS